MAGKSVTISASAVTRWGDTVFVTGSGAALGEWDLSRAIKMSTTPETYPSWTARLEASALSFEWKLVIVKEGHVTWEEGPNRVLSLGAQCDEFLVETAFGDRSCTVTQTRSISDKFGEVEEMLARLEQEWGNKFSKVEKQLAALEDMLRGLVNRAQSHPSSLAVVDSKSCEETDTNSRPSSKASSTWSSWSLQESSVPPAAAAFDPWAASAAKRDEASVSERAEKPVVQPDFETLNIAIMCASSVSAWPFIDLADNLLFLISDPTAIADDFRLQCEEYGHEIVETPFVGIAGEPTKQRTLERWFHKLLKDRGSHVVLVSTGYPRRLSSYFHKNSPCGVAHHKPEGGYVWEAECKWGPNAVKFGRCWEVAFGDQGPE